jgi:hypothetical protein
MIDLLSLRSDQWITMDPSSLLAKHRGRAGGYAAQRLRSTRRCSGLASLAAELHIVGLSRLAAACCAGVKECRRDASDQRRTDRVGASNFNAKGDTSWSLPHCANGCAVSSAPGTTPHEPRRRTSRPWQGLHGTSASLPINSAQHRSPSIRSGFESPNTCRRVCSTRSSVRCASCMSRFWIVGTRFSASRTREARSGCQWCSRRRRRRGFWARSRSRGIACC